MRSKLLLATLLLVACADHDRNAPYQGEPIYPGVSAMLDGSTADRNQQAEATIANIESWQAHFGRAPNTFLLTVMKDLAKVQQVAPGASGYTVFRRGDTTLVVVWAGVKNELPALYHELCHVGGVSQFTPDGKHQDNRWPQWDREGNRLSDLLRSQR